MDDYNQTTVAVVIALLGTGVAGSALAVLWNTVTSRQWPDKDTVLGLTRIFMGMSIVAVAFAILYRYVLT